MCSADPDCVQCFGMAALLGTSVAEVSGCETASMACPAYSAIGSMEDDEEYDIPNAVGTTLCMLSTIQCDYMYHEGVSVVTGNSVYEIEPATCLLIPWWGIPILVVSSLFLLGFIILVTGYLLLRWLDYREVKRFEKSVQEADFGALVNRAYQSPEVKYDNPLHGSAI